MTILICKTILASSIFFNPIWLDSHPNIKQEARLVCEEVVEKSIDTGIDPVLVAALSYSESRFKRNLRSKAGAIGPMQVKVKWTCPNGERRGCDLVQAGITHLKRLGLRYGCGEDSKKHAEALLWKDGNKAFNAWADSQELCLDPDWETVLCHYNSGTKCLNRGFPRLILSRYKKIRSLMEKGRNVRDPE
ncbi:MAG: hypothetical protein CMA70_04795 [Euryarchaeota archaeon]|mgnify:CR=1 FL=1|nr:hypothetical protein [Euryarchaeota archaeon]